MMQNSLSDYTIDYTLASNLELSFLKEAIFIPIKEEELFIKIAISNDNFDDTILSSTFDKPIKKISFSKNEVLQSLHLFDIKSKLFKISLENIDQELSIDKFLTYLAQLALDLNASDIHIESNLNSFCIRLRIDGILKHIITLEKKFLNTLSSYIKLKANLDISLKRLPQDSSFTLNIKNTKYDFRISTMPTIDGESLVIRILENSAENKKLSTLGFDKSSYENIKQKLYQSNGLILITGPTGSGKTTTLYSMIKEINYTGKKIITIEDPVEYKIKNVQQIAVNNSIGLSFQKILTNILRQDPDVILIGEIRDKESLKIAIQASLTGHLVLATLHTNSALNTINRILDLGGEPFLLANTLKSIISQRLVRKLCCRCKTYDKNSDSYVPTGCEECNFDGYKGRVVLYELLNIDEKIANMLAKSEDSDTILKHLKQNNFTPLEEFSKTIIKDGISSIKEVYKVISI